MEQETSKTSLQQDEFKLKKKTKTQITNKNQAAVICAFRI